MPENNEPIIWARTNRPGNYANEPDYDEMFKHVEQSHTPEARRWLAAVVETQLAWDISVEEATELVHELQWDAADHHALQWAKKEMPEWQRRLEHAAWNIADLLPLSLLSPMTVRRLRQGLAAYDRATATEED